MLHHGAACGRDLPYPIPSHPTGSGSPGMPHISASPVINKGGMRLLCPPSCQGSLSETVPSSLLLLSHHQHRDAQSCSLAPAPASTQWGTTKHPKTHGWGKKEKQQKELLHNPHPC